MQFLFYLIDVYAGERVASKLPIWEYFAAALSNNGATR